MASTLYRPLVCGVLALSALGACETTGSSRYGPPLQKATLKEIEQKFPSPSGGSGAKELLCYTDPTDPSTLINVFWLPSQRVYVSVTPYAKSEGGNYAGDEFLVMVVGGQGWRLDPNTAVYEQAVLVDGLQATVRPSQKDSEITVVDTFGGRQATFTLSKLTRLRLQNLKDTLNVGKNPYRFGYQARDGALLLYDPKVESAWIDPEAPRESLTPRYVIPSHRKDENGKWVPLTRAPIGNSGYVMVFPADGSPWYADLAR